MRTRTRGDRGWVAPRRAARARTGESTITFIVLGAAVAVFVWDRLPVAIVAIGVALSLWATGVLDLDALLAGLFLFTATLG